MGKGVGVIIGLIIGILVCVSDAHHGRHNAGALLAGPFVGFCVGAIVDWVGGDSPGGGSSRGGGGGYDYRRYYGVGKHHGH